ncbi:type II CAAX endopeptidase family protein [Aliiglaciecola sp. LCG003]|uniref:CPBP family intramembrane glutamic endopeptidase n=1 Tax=Aliiglaciecola sp. LCG003 TaxID=3053655 RepID=UPI00257370EA|nr:type II CAAX endopeptidase family protein [Aliiglaciecola sp. LCG003]WJG08423.1 type II CAAX endopeptidase family protein [Aliiglaciecola sp. LCG003]
MLKNPPSLLIALGLVITWIILQILLGLVLYQSGLVTQSSVFWDMLVVTIATGMVVLLAMKHTELSFSGLWDDSGNQFRSTATLLFPPICVVLVGALWWFADIQMQYFKLIPPSPEILKHFDMLMTGGIWSILAVCVIAPVIEEVLFRGIIFRGFLHHYPPSLAIVLSAVLFAGAHLNLYQFLVALVMGIFLAWIYYKSRSLWPCIFAHAVFNTSAYIGYQPIEQYQYNSVVVNGLTFGLSVAGLYLLSQVFNRGFSRRKLI